jgi:hypothetical protein
MNDQDHSLSLSDPDRSLVLSHLLLNFLKNLVSCQTSFMSYVPSVYMSLSPVSKYSFFNFLTGEINFQNLPIPPIVNIFFLYRL